MAINTSILTAGVNNHLTTSEEANGVYTDFVGQGIVGTIGNTSGVAPATGGFAVNAQGTPDTTIAVSAGVAYVTGTPTSQNSQTFRVKNSASANTTISANSSGSTKYDWVYIKLDATKLNAPNTAGDDAATIFVSRSSSASADDGTPPTYGYNIAVVTVANGFSTITNGNISDKRAQVNLVTGSTSSTTGWTATSTPTTITALGNRSYTVLFPSVDITGTVSAGMRLKLTRTVTAPTQCTDLESSSSQYYNKTSPAGMTFTDDFVVSAWVKLESYGVIQTIASRYNGTSGWQFRVDATGQIALYGFNAGSTNYSGVVSYQSIPLGKWVHVAAQLDMSTFTATTTTSYVMLDGVNVPATVGRAGTNPTALVQAGNLEIGAANSGVTTFDGKLAQVAIYSAKVTQATILASINQTLSGTETSLISAYTFNNSINDLNANANNLTAQGSAVATNSDTPFTNDVTGTSITAGTTDFGIVTNATFSTNTTLTVQLPEGATLPTSGGISAVSYSTQKVPYGMPTDSSKYVVCALVLANSGAVTISAPNVWTTLLHKVNAPIGAWRPSIEGTFQGAATTFTHGHILLAPATPTNAARTSDLVTIMYNGAAPANVLVTVARHSVNPMVFTSATDLLLYGDVATTTGATTITPRGDLGPITLSLECAYI